VLAVVSEEDVVLPAAVSECLCLQFGCLKSEIVADVQPVVVAVVVGPASVVAV